MMYTIFCGMDARNPEGTSFLNLDGSLKNDIERSNVFTVGTQDGYSKDDVDRLLKSGAGIYQFYEFYYGLQNSESTVYSDIRNAIETQGKIPVVLGTDIGDNLHFAPILFDGHGWTDAYNKLHIDPKDPTHTQQFMAAITAPDSSYIPLFCIPKGFTKRHRGAPGPEGSVTYREFKYLLDHPDRTKTVHFLFGGSDYLKFDFYMDRTLNGKQYRDDEARFEVYKKCLIHSFLL